MKTILSIYIIITIVGYQWVNDTLFIDIIKPIFFAALVFYAYKKSGNYHGRFKNVKNNSKLMIILAIMYIIVFSMSGLLTGFSYSIYSHKFLMILKNIYHTTLIIALIEYLRSYIINQNIKNKLHIIFTTTIFILIEVNFGVLFSKFTDGETAFEYISSIILPLLFSNIFYSYAALKGGFKLTIPYRVIISVFILVTPIVPAFDWFLTGAFGTLFLIMALMMMQRYSQKTTTIRREGKKSALAYFACFGTMIVFVMAVTGFFRYKPIVILSNSMVPEFSKGDVVVYYEPSEEEKNNLEINTIIVYTKDNQYVVHRIVRKFKKSGETFYITRGDANNSDDYAPVPTDEIIGVYTISLKYVGYPSVWLNNTFNQTQAVVETK